MPIAVLSLNSWGTLGEWKSCGCPENDKSSKVHFIPTDLGAWDAQYVKSSYKKKKFDHAIDIMLA